MDALQAAEDATAPVQAKTEPKAAAPPKPIKEPPKKKRKTPSPSIPIPVFDLEEPTYVPPKSRAPPRISVSAGEDVFGDAVIASQKPCSSLAQGTPCGMAESERVSRLL